MTNQELAQMRRVMTAASEMEPIGQMVGLLLDICPRLEGDDRYTVDLAARCLKDLDAMRVRMMKALDVAVAADERVRRGLGFIP